MSIKEMIRNKKEMPRVVGIKQVVDNSQQIIINGVLLPKNIYLLYCEVCGRVVHQFDQPGLGYGEIVKLTNGHKKELENNFTYCPKCGQKLSYEMEVIDVEATVVEDADDLITENVAPEASNKSPESDFTGEGAITPPDEKEASTEPKNDSLDLDNENQKNEQ